MLAHFNRTYLLVLVALVMMPARASAQLSIPGKLMTYRTVDSDSGEELQRMRSWEALDGPTIVDMNETTFPSGTELIRGCAFANGGSKPATSFRSVMHARSGELERSDFDTLDPLYYPFLAQPITAEMQPASCLNRRALDLPTLLGGGTFKLWMWSDSGLVGAVFHGEATEKLTVAAGTFDAMRVRIDVDLSKLFPHVPALFLALIKPHFTIWIATAAPYYVLKLVGFGFNTDPKHKNTFIELASITDLAGTALPPTAELKQADVVSSDPPLTRDNAARFSQGDRTGKVILSTAATPAGELLMAHVGFNNGLATESRSLINLHASPVTAYMDDRSLAANGALMRKHLLFIRPAAFPDDSDKDLPADLYGGDTTLGLVLPRLLPTDSDEMHFHVIDFYGQVNELVIRREGLTTVALGLDDAPVVHAKLKPIIEVPLLLRPVAYFFIPSFDVYFEAEAPHRLVKFEGPLGPPGVPNATMVAEGPAS